MLVAVLLGTACGAATGTTTTSSPSTTAATAGTVAPVDSAETSSSSVNSRTTTPTTDSRGLVSYLDPPPTLTMHSLGTVPVPAPSDGGYEVAIGDLGVAVATWRYGDRPDTTLTVIGVDGQQRRLDVDDTLPGILAYGPGDVAYIFDQSGNPVQDFAVVAVPLSGDHAGMIVASNKVPINTYMELPRAAFGHGTNGIIDRQRDVNTTLLDYVDVTGAPITWTSTAPPLLTTTDDSEPAADSIRLTIHSSAAETWQLTIDAAPDRAAPYNGPSPAAPSSDGLNVYWTHIGPNARPDIDFGEPTMWVIATLQHDGNGQWWSLPQGWEVVASDVWGTVLAKRSNDNIELSLATLNPDG